MTDTLHLTTEREVYVPAVSSGISQVSWGAVLAGVAVALSLQLLLNLLGVGIGLSVLDPASSDNPDVSTVSIVGGVWFVVAGLLASLCGGYAASRMSGRPGSMTGGFHGIVSWAVTTLFVVYLLTTSAGILIGGAFSGVSSMISGTGQTATAVATAAAPALASTADPFAAIERQIREASGGTDPEALRSAAVAAVRASVTGDEAAAQDARERAAAAIARAQNIPVEQARQQVQRYEDEYRAALEQMKQKAVKTAEVTANAAGTASIFAFISLAIGAIAAWLGGVAGSKSHEELEYGFVKRTDRGFDPHNA